LILASSGMILTFLLAVVFTSAACLCSYASASESISSPPINGVVMKGAFVSMKQNANISPSAPQDYIEDSLKNDIWSGFESCPIRVLLGGL
jgi:hypothetical protein